MGAILREEDLIHLEEIVSRTHEQGLVNDTHNSSLRAPNS